MLEKPQRPGGDLGLDESSQQKGGKSSYSLLFISKGNLKTIVKSTQTFSTTHQKAKVMLKFFQKAQQAPNIRIGWSLQNKRVPNTSQTYPVVLNQPKGRLGLLKEQKRILL